MASVAICTAVWKPKVTSVPSMSLSIVLGTPTTATPSLVELVADAEGAVAADDDEARRCRGRRGLAQARSTPSSTVRGCVREVPEDRCRPRAACPACARTSSGDVPARCTPRQPSWKPTSCRRRSRSPLRTIARITALSPGQSPPPVRTPTRIGQLPRPDGATADRAARPGLRSLRPHGRRHRHRRRHHRRARPSPSTSPGAAGRHRPTGSSPSTSPGRAGSSTTPPRSGTAMRGHAGRADRPRSTQPVAAIGITNQRETVVAWDRRTGAPAAPGHRLAGPPHRRPLRRSSRPPATSRRAGDAPAWCSTPTSRPPSSSGC